MAIAMRESTSLNRMDPDPCDNVKIYLMSPSSASSSATPHLTTGSVLPADFDTGDVTTYPDYLLPFTRVMNILYRSDTLLYDVR